VEDISLMRSIPNMTVINPSDAVETKAAIEAVAKIDGPCFVRLGRMAVNVINDRPEYKFEIGKGVTVSEGKDVTLIATGYMVSVAMAAAEELKSQGISARVVNIHTIKPIDKDIIVKAAKETGAIVTCEEHNVIGGLGSAVAEVLVENYPVPVKMLGVQDKFGKSGKAGEVMKMYGLTSEGIVNKAKEVMAMKKA
jgi:transketolase